MPLTFANGAAPAPESIGTAVLGGVITSTFLVTIFAPLFYVLIPKDLWQTRSGKQPSSLSQSPSGNR